MGNLVLGTKPYLNRVNIQRTTVMACILTNIDTEQFVERNDITEEKIAAENPLEKYLIKHNNITSLTKHQNTICIKWPMTLSSNSSTWLSTRKVGSEKKMTNTNNWIEKKTDAKPEPEKRTTDNPWSEKKANYNPWLINRGMNLTGNLANTTSEGLLISGVTQAREDLKERKVDNRIPLPISEVVSTFKETDEDEDKPVLRKSKSSRISGTGINSGMKKNEPWVPKSLAKEVKLGLLKRSGNLNKSLLNDVAESANDAAKESKAAINVGNWILTDSKPNYQKMNFMAASQRFGSLPQPLPVGKHSTEIQNKPWVPKSLAEKVRIGLLRSAGKMDKEDTDSENTAKETVNLNNSKIDSTSSSIIGDSLLNSSHVDAEHSPENLDTWIMDDNQSEASIITLDTITDNGDMDDFDDFADMEHELSMWISKA